MTKIKKPKRINQVDPYRQVGISGDTVAIWNDLRRVFGSWQE